GLVPHAEGGWFTETYRSAEPGPGARSAATAIYYLLRPGHVSAMHRLASDEIFHFYLGDPVEMLLLGTGREARMIRLGTDLEAGEGPRVVVPRGIWRGSAIVPGGSFALLGTTVAPGFAYEDFELGEPDRLAA